MAPVVAELTNHPSFQTVTVVTAQHREMLDQVLHIFNIVPAYDLDIMAPGQSLPEITARVLQKLTPVIAAEKPDVLLVHGDTTTTFAGSLAAFYQGVKVGHVEAGLRTGDKLQPYPEEMNRLLTARLADFHFAPTRTARENLIRENISAASILITGNTVIDALHLCLTKISRRAPRPSMERMILVTAHRRENWGEPLQAIAKALDGILRDNPEVRIVIPMHKNPEVRSIFQRRFENEPRVALLEPFDYLEMVRAMEEAFLVITDSGGVQEEAPALGKPVLVLRNKTERPEAVNAGTVKLVGTETEQIRRVANELLNNPSEYQRMARAVNPYGDGLAAKRISAGLLYRFGLNMKKPADFEI